MTVRLARDREWTYDDYLATPDDGQRYEIIDGVLYVSAAPLTVHQLLSRRLQFFLYQFELEGKGYVYDAPVDVLMPGCTPVQPDLVFLTSDQRVLIQERGIVGVPFLLVEILSPSNRSLDRVKKLNRYAKNGVPFYLIVDPDGSTLEVLALQGQTYTIERSLGEDDSWEFMGQTLNLAALFAPLT